MIEGGGGILEEWMSLVYLNNTFNGDMALIKNRRFLVSELACSCYVCQVQMINQLSPGSTLVLRSLNSPAMDL
jgi:hypothetical protein